MIEFNEFIERVKRETDIVEVIGEYVPSLKKAGKNFKGLCPFHKEKTPSFSINPAAQYYHCFGCNANGDVIKFVQQVESLEFKEAIALLAQRRGIAVPEFRRESSEAQRGKQQLKQALFELHNIAQEIYRTQLKQSSLAKNYCSQRALAPDICSRFGIGYIPNEPTLLVRHARKKGYSDEALLESGLALRSERSGELYDRFRGRLTFPIHDTQKRIVGFGGRLMEEAKNKPKYLNSSDSPIFHKGRLLYGFHLAQAAIREQKRALLCEGYMDLIALHAHGFQHAVANLGTALTEDQGRLLQRVCSEVVFLYDGDEAGQKAMLRGTEVLLPLEFQIKVVTFKQGDDPDSLLARDGHEGLQAMLDNAVDYLDFFLASAAKRFDKSSAQGKAAIVDETISLLGKISNPIIAQDVRRRIADFLRIEERLVNQALARKQRSQSAGLKEELQKQEQAPHSEARLLQFMVEHPDVRLFMAENLDPELLSHEMTRFWVREIIGLTRKDAVVTAQSLNADPPTDNEQAIAFLRKTLMQDSEPVKDLNQLCQQMLQKLQLHSRRRQSRDIRHQLSQQESADPENSKSLAEAFDKNWKDQKQAIDQLYKPNFSLHKK